MAMTPPSQSSQSVDSGDRPWRPLPPAACEACRRQKMRCIYSHDTSATASQRQPCDRCRRNNRLCLIPERKTQGRRPGSVGRYSGVEKAVRQIQTQVRKASRKSNRGHGLQNETGADHHFPSPKNSDVLEILLHFSKQSQSSQNYHDHHQPVETGASTPLTDKSPPAQDHALIRSDFDHSESTNKSLHRKDDSVSNPLGLLGDASGEAQAGEDRGSIHCQQIDPALLTALPGSHHFNSDTNLSSTLDPVLVPDTPTIYDTAQSMLSRPGYVSLGLKLDRSILESALDNLLTRSSRIGRYADYFKTKNVEQAQDTGPDVDPVDLGLISMQEVWYLFPIFFERLHPINGILDPGLHTPDFVRPRSALLFTWILAITAQFDHSSGPLATRLRLHGEKLSKHVHSCGYKSVEIAQGYYISLLAAVPANTLAEDHSWIYTNYALGMISDMGLDRQNGSSMESSSPGTMDDLGVIQQEQEQKPCAARLVRNRERTWFRILLWERAHSAACGRVTPFPENELTRRVQDWWRHPLADPTDRYTCAFIILRRHLSMLFHQVKDRFGRPDNPRHWVRDLVDSTLDPWRRSWIPETTPSATTADHMRNLFLHYVYMHGRLWTLSFALHDPSNNAQDADATKDDCFEAAVNCCEVTIRDLREIGEPMYCLMAPTWAMSSYAAVLALKLFPQLYGDRPGQKVELLAMLAEVALQLERSGTTPSHRFGVGALLGQHLFLVLRRHLSELKNEVAMAGVDPLAAIMPSTSVAGNLTVGGFQSLLSGDSEGHTAVDIDQHEEQAMNASACFDDPFLLDGLSPGGAGALQDAFADMMREWGGPPFPLDSAYY